MDIAITASNGRVFKGNNYDTVEKSCLEYEYELKKKEYLFNQILDNANSLSKAVESYCELTGERIRYLLEDGKISCKAYHDDFAELEETFDNWYKSNF